MTTTRIRFADLDGMTYTTGQQPSAEIAFHYRWHTGTHDDISPKIVQSTQFVMSEFGRGGFVASVARTQYCGPPELWEHSRTDRYLQTRRNLANPHLDFGI